MLLLSFLQDLRASGAQLFKGAAVTSSMYKGYETKHTWIGIGLNLRQCPGGVRARLRCVRVEEHHVGCSCGPMRTCSSEFWESVQCFPRWNREQWERSRVAACEAQYSLLSSDSLMCTLCISSSYQIYSWAQMVVLYSYCCFVETYALYDNHLHTMSVWLSGRSYCRLELMRERSEA